VKKSFWNLVLRFFKSIKLALILIGYLVITSIIATLVPQGREASFYSHEFSPLVARIILQFNLDNFFRSVLFLAPATLFFINLNVCTIYRFVTRIKRGAKLRLGPDILHVGLIILMIAGVVTLFERQEASVFLAPGDIVKLQGGYRMALESFRYAVYESGRPREWVSEVKFGTQGKLDREKKIEVNRPLRIGSLNIFQSSYKDLSVIALEAMSGANKGKVYSMHTGNAIRVGNKTYNLIQVATDESGLVTEVRKNGDTTGDKLGAVFIVFEKNGKATRKIYRIGDTIDDYRIKDIVPWMETGLMVVEDPGFVPILLGLLVLITGLMLTFYQKIKDKKI